jgi:alkanesulfonate monooxygenase SsuD/methylene tetrahydromethanopterin reductase-like flavin-dependent oxidoreductase (luciferase family)
MTGMRFGVAHEMSRPPESSRAWREVWDDELWFLCELEQLGYDHIGVEEHFFAPDAHGPAPIAMASALIQRTDTIQVGSYATVLPLHHPVQLAHEWATLDQLSGGRTFITVVPGYRPHEYRAFGLDPRTRASRVEEGFGLLRRALVGGPLTHHGRHWQVDDLHLVPEALQNPYPLWGGGSSVASARRAARNRAHLAALSIDPAVFTAYREELVAQGEEPDDYRISLGMSLTATTEDPEEVWRRHLPLFIRRYAEPESYGSEYGDAGFDIGSGASGGDEQRWRANEVIGTPEQILEVIDGLRKVIPFTDIVNLAPAPGIPLRSEGIESARLLAEEVLPVLRGW